jgi:DNA-binding transcriptional LysR family regulator
MIAWDLHRLHLLRELQERGTLAAVAEALSYSPSSVSQQLAVLEREAGVPLLEKAGRGVRLTDAANLLAQHAAVLLAASEAAEADLANLTGQIRGTVRAGGLQSGTRALLIPALGRFHVDHPQVRVEITEMELEQALPELRLGGLDLILSDEYDGHPRPRPAGVRFATLHEEPLRLVLPSGHPQAGTSAEVDLASLRDEVWVASAPGTGHHALVVSTCRALGGFDPDLRHRSNDNDVQLDLVRTTGAVGLMPVLTIPGDADGIAIRDLAGAHINRRLSLVTRDGPPTPALRAFLAAVEDHAGRTLPRAATAPVGWTPG